MGIAVEAPWLNSSCREIQCDTAVKKGMVTRLGLASDDGDDERRPWQCAVSSVKRETEGERERRK